MAEETKKLNIPVKANGDTFVASEVNDIVAAINSNAEDITTVDEKADAVQKQAGNNAADMVLALSYIRALQIIVGGLPASQGVTIEDEGFFLVDSNGNIGLRFDNGGFDVALINDNFLSLFRIGEKNGIAKLDENGKVSLSQLPAFSTLELGLTSDTAYSGDKGVGLENSIKSISDSISKLIKDTLKINSKVESIFPVGENGFYVTDEAGNIGMKFTSDGLDVININNGTQFELELISDKEYNI